jgi:cellobiose phosphorylase
MISPSAHTRTQEDIDCYKVEPYVIAADVYGAEPHIGRGGWTWYTGSAGWIYRVAIESILGLSIKGGDTILIQPCIPDDWEGYEISYRDPVSESTYHIKIINPHRCSAKIISATLDLTPIAISENTALIPMRSKKKTHHVIITLGS